MDEQLQSHYKPPNPWIYAVVCNAAQVCTVLFFRMITGNYYYMIRGYLMPLSFLVPMYVLYKYIRYDVPEQYKEGNWKVWVHSCVRMILPGEAIRMVLSCITLGTTPWGQIFAPFSWFLTEWLYLTPLYGSGAGQTNWAMVTVSSWLLYPLFYLLYLFITYLPFVFLMYKLAWNDGQKEYERLRQRYKEHETEAAERDAAPDAEMKKIPSQKEKDYAMYNSFQGKQRKK